MSTFQTFLLVGAANAVRIGQHTSEEVNPLLAPENFMPSGWTKETASDGETFWSNAEMGKAVWDAPQRVTPTAHGDDHYYLADTFTAAQYNLIESAQHFDEIETNFDTVMSALNPNHEDCKIRRFVGHAATTWFVPTGEFTQTFTFTVIKFNPTRLEEVTVTKGARIESIGGVSYIDNGRDKFHDFLFIKSKDDFDGSVKQPLQQLQPMVIKPFDPSVKYNEYYLLGRFSPLSHGAIVYNNIEYSFSQSLEGVFLKVPGTDRNYWGLKATHELGERDDFEEVARIFDTITAQDWHGNDYNVLSKNCNDFGEMAARALGLRKEFLRQCFHMNKQARWTRDEQRLAAGHAHTTEHEPVEAHQFKSAEELLTAGFTTAGEVMFKTENHSADNDSFSISLYLKQDNGQFKDLETNDKTIQFYTLMQYEYSRSWGFAGWGYKLNPIGPRKGF